MTARVGSPASEATSAKRALVAMGAVSMLDGAREGVTPSLQGEGWDWGWVIHAGYSCVRTHPLPNPPLEGEGTVCDHRPRSLRPASRERFGAHRSIFLELGRTVPP